MTIDLVRSLGVGRCLNWKALNVEGSTGGILLLWDNSRISLVDFVVGGFSVSCLFRMLEDRFPTQRCLPRPVYDHFPILLDSDGVRMGPSPFRFELMWLKYEGFKEILKGWWQNLHFYGSFSFILFAKLKALKGILKA